jgi:uncharacterized protein YidB (DUF937 family)
MGLLDQIFGGLDEPSTDRQPGSVFLDLATAVVQEHPGGLAGLLQQFTAAGLGQEADSWVSAGQNMPISTEQLSRVLGRGNVGTLAEKFNISPDSASFGLASLLPPLIDYLTPKGQVDSESSLAAALGALRGQLKM